MNIPFKLSRVVQLGSLLAVLVLLFDLAGCTGPFAGKKEHLLHPKIAVQQYDLQQNLYFGEPIVDPGTPDRPMRVTVPVRADENFAVNIQYMFEFFDERGRPLASSAGWMRQSLTPGMQVFLDGAAMETKAVDWRLKVRSAI